MEFIHATNLINIMDMGYFRHLRIIYNLIEIFYKRIVSFCLSVRMYLFKEELHTKALAKL